MLVFLLQSVEGKLGFSYNVPQTSSSFYSLLSFKTNSTVFGICYSSTSLPGNASICIGFLANVTNYHIESTDRKPWERGEGTGAKREKKQIA